jgi:predicted glycoside hydrolase/deacetylase ChbG (UPF0249 family)
MAVKRLIVNADDLGADEARNAGIFEAVDAGAVTSVSVLANGPAFPDVPGRIAAAARLGISCGIHLNLTEGKPLTPGLAGLTDCDGRFPGKTEAHRRLMRRGGQALEDAIGLECSAQIEALLKAGIRIDHLDGHQHIHIFPAVIESAVRAAEAFGIPWIRVPEEPIPVFQDRGSPVETGEAEMFCRLAAAARGRIRQSALKTTDHFRGLYLKGRLSPGSLEETLRALPTGITELMVHPGRVSAWPGHGPFSSFSHRDREMELETLTNAGFRKMLARLDFRLTSYAKENP